MSELQYLEQRISQLKAKLAQRQSQAGNATAEGVVSSPSVFINSAYQALREASIEYVELKCKSGQWCPLKLIDLANANSGAL